MNSREYEKTCYNFLQNKFNENANFILKGGNDSTKSDILVTTKNNNKFYIEVKKPSAQSGQFVLYPDNSKNKFIYSNKNKTNENIYSRKIINYMNKNFKQFNNPKTAGIEIKMNNKKVFYKWIIDHYNQKNSKLLITGKPNKLIIFPIIEIEKFFHVSAKYRIKNSGSSSVGVRSAKKVYNYINSKYKNISSYHIEKSKLFISTTNTNLNKEIFSFDDNSYMFSKRKNEFEVRKLSKTKNANVIFSIKLKENVHGLTDSEIISNYLNF